MSGQLQNLACPYTFPSKLKAHRQFLLAVGFLESLLLSLIFRYLPFRQKHIDVLVPVDVVVVIRFRVTGFWLTESMKEILYSEIISVSTLIYFVGLNSGFFADQGPLILLTTNKHKGDSFVWD